MSDSFLFRKSKLNPLILPALLIVTGINLISKASEPSLRSFISSPQADDKSLMPDTLAGARMKAILKLLQSVSSPDIDTFLDRYDPGSSQLERTEWKEHFTTMRELLGTNVRFNDVLWSEEHNIGVRVSNAALTKWHKIILEISDVVPHDILRLGLRRAEAPDPEEAPQLTAAQQATIVRSVAAELRKGYIIDQTGQKLADRIEANLKSNVYDSITSPKLFAARMTEDFRSVCSDKHLAVFAPEKMPLKRKKDNSQEYTNAEPQLEPLEEHPKLEMHVPRDLSGEKAFMVQRLRDDTIGLVTFTSMYSNDDEAVPRVAALMDSLTGVKAIIFDLREANGGDPSFVMALLSNFFEKPTHVSTVATKWPPDYELTLKEFWTTPNERSPEFASVPIYILISPRTASGPEVFTSSLKNQDRATLIGERTAGAGHLATNVIVAEGFVLKLPIGRGIDPKTGEGKGIEGIGNVPDIEVSAQQALDSALELIRKE